MLEEIINRKLNNPNIEMGVEEFEILLLKTEDEEIINETLNFLKDPTCFERTNLERHFTASAWIVTENNQRALITHHKKLGLKLQLGGHCDGDSNILRVALREAMEESGITDIKYSKFIFDIDIHTIPESKNSPSHSHYDIRFLFIVPNDAKYTVSEESSNLEWITKDYNVSECTPGFVRLFEKWKTLDLNLEDFREL